MNKTRSRILQSLASGVNRFNDLRISSTLLKNTLTVLNYHRIDNPHASNFNTLKANVSATPFEFERQMQYLKRTFNIINCQQLVDYITKDIPLPPRSAMVTFDDGYFDNYSYAYPILKELKIPAVIFLATDYIGTNQPFYWDYAAYCFSKTKLNRALLPVIGERAWSNEKELDFILYDWIETLKKIQEQEKQIAINSIATALSVSVPENAFNDLHLNWQQVREMHKNGIEFGAHTASHPILTRIPLHQAQNEILSSKLKIENEINAPVVSFAYPNGGIADFSLKIMQMISQSGIPIAFSLLPGPTFYKTVKKEPFSIRRIFLIHTDTFERFVLKVNGISRLAEAIGR
jgi:peptidoglycan/xylan/chitin deacetylase (PgdA/CDA1 family)